MANKGLGFFGALTLIFITLKLLNIITWSWIWVLAPIWIGPAIIGLVVFALLIINLKN